MEPLVLASCKHKFETGDMPSCRNGTQWLTTGVEVMASQWHGTPTVTDIYKNMPHMQNNQVQVELFLISHYGWLYSGVLKVIDCGVQAIISTVNHNMQIHVKIEAGRRVDGRS